MMTETASFIPHRDDAQTARFVGKCKCGKVCSVLSAARRYHRRLGFMYETSNGFFGEDDRGRTLSIWLTCQACPGWVRLWKVCGKYNPAKVCNARCMGATTGACECSCGGKNHGSSHG